MSSIDGYGHPPGIESNNERKERVGLEKESRVRKWRSVRKFKMEEGQRKREERQKLSCIN